MSDALPAPGSVIGGRYRIESLLGQGGMGAVLAAVNEATGRAVAIKWMLRSAGSEEGYARFMAEARAMARIEHPNVVAVLDVGREDGSLFLVMERLRGESLRERIEGTRLSVAEALDVVIPVCRGVAEAHREHVIHRDLKPDNIFLCEAKDGSPRAPKVLDFGVAKLVERAGGPSITKSGAALGTPSYMAPEQIGSAREVDVRVDVYAMGVVLYRALSGRLPYEAEGIYELVLRISQGKPTPLRTLAPDVPPELEATIARAMSVEREHRHASMGELLAELEGIRARMIGEGPAIQAPLEMARGGTLPLGAVPPAPPAERPQRAADPRPPGERTHATRPRSRRAAAPAKRGKAVALALIGGATLLGLSGIAVGAGQWLRQREDRQIEPRPTEATGGGDVDPLRPRIDLRFSGDCHPSFTGPLTVSTAPVPLISIVSTLGGGQVGALLLQTHEPPRGTIPIDRMVTEHLPSVMVRISETRAHVWASWGPGTDPREASSPVSGSITFNRYEPSRGIVDLTFNDLALQHGTSESVCRVDGRLQTFGLTWGAP